MKERESSWGVRRRKSGRRDPDEYKESRRTEEVIQKKKNGEKMVGKAEEWGVRCSLSLGNRFSHVH